jgi:glycosyltransferase involved in cell wall biosynthesis
VLVTVGRLGAEKNVQELISFLRSGGKVGRRVKLLIVGDGPIYGGSA